jgi:hypothetical protein
LYHVIVTIISFGFGRVPPIGILLVRDGGRLCVIFLLSIRYLHVVHVWVRRWAVPLCIALCLMIVSLCTSIALDSNVGHIVVGVKYTLYYIVPMCTAIFVGYVWIDELSRHPDFSARVVGRNVDTFMKWVFCLVVCVLAFGWIWQ